jgi:hypothetical protein
MLSIPTTSPTMACVGTLENQSNIG